MQMTRIITSTLGNKHLLNDVINVSPLHCSATSLEFAQWQTVPSLDSERANYSYYFNFHISLNRHSSPTINEWTAA